MSASISLTEYVQSGFNEGSYNKFNWIYVQSVFNECSYNSLTEDISKLFNECSYISLTDDMSNQSWVLLH